MLEDRFSLINSGKCLLALDERRDSYAAFPDGDLALTVFGNPCAGRLISCRFVGRRALDISGNTTILAVRADL